jgi:hypothetical protein
VSDSHMDLQAEVPETVARRLKLKEYALKETLWPSGSYG